MVALIALREPKGHVASQGTAASVGRGSTGGSSTKPSPSSTPHSSTSAPHKGSSNSEAAAVKSVPLIVLNNTTTSGLAKRAAERFEAGGWTVSRYDNYQNDIASTCAYYDPSASGAKQAAKALRRQFPTIKRVEPRFAELPEGPVVVVLTPDYSAS